MSVIKEFKEFISRGNVVDMAVGVVVGSAFTNIVNSLATDILTPCISFIIGKIDISSLSIEVNENLIIPYGSFLQSIVNVLLTAVAIFMIVKVINSVRDRMERLAKKDDAEEEAAESEPELSNEEQLLTEIRDLLKASKTE